MTDRERIDALEHRLADYHGWLNEAIEERDRLALDAAWGVHYALYSNLGTLLVFGGAYIAYDRQSWIIGIIVAALWLVPQMAIHSWSNGQRMKEVDRLAKLPEWERVAS